MLLKYYDVNRQLSDDYRYEIENKENFVDRLKEHYETFKFRNNVDDFYLHSDNILNEDRPGILNFIVRNDTILDILKKLEYMKFYNYNAYMSITYLLEFFFKEYYMALDKDDSDAQQVLVNIKDVKKKIMGIFGALSVDLPVKDKNRTKINRELYENKEQLRNIMKTKIFILSKNCNKHNLYEHRHDSIEIHDGDNIDKYGVL